MIPPSLPATPTAYEPEPLTVGAYQFPPGFANPAYADPAYAAPAYAPGYADPYAMAPGYVVGYAMAWPEKRLHPATIFISAARVLRSIAIILAIALYRRIKTGTGDTLEVVAALLGSLGVLGAVFKYVTTTYTIRDNALHLRTGLLVRQDRVVPLERIQNINQKQDLLHRLFGVVDLHVETASGAGAAEVSLSAVSFAEADLLREALAQRSPHPTTAGDHRAEPTAGETVYRASLRDLIVAGATTNRLGKLLATTIGLGATYHAYFGDDRRLGPVIARTANHFEVPAWTTIAGLGVGVALLGWLTSITLTVVGKYGFRLVRARGQLERTFGLITKHRSIFPVQRVQMLRIVSPLIQRKLGLCHVSAETAGSFREESAGHDPGTSELCPILRTRDAAAMCRLALPRFDFDDLRWTPTSSIALWRRFVRIALVIVAAAVAFALLLDRRGWFGLFAVPLVAWPVAWAYWRSVGYCVQGRFFAAKSGVFTRTIRVVPLAKVQASFVTRSPLQKQVGVASLHVLTAGSMFGGRAHVPDMTYADALALQETIHNETGGGAATSPSRTPAPVGTSVTT